MPWTKNVSAHRGTDRERPIIGENGQEKCDAKLTDPDAQNENKRIMWGVREIALTHRTMFIRRRRIKEG